MQKKLPSNSTLAELESARGLAIVMVVVFHYLGSSVDLIAYHESMPFLVRIFAGGNTGVTLFFVLSGFLLARYFISRDNDSPARNVKIFFINRILRIFPLYFLVLFVAWCITDNSQAAIRAIFFIPIGFQMGAWGVPWWSLSTEMQFYLLLPIFYLISLGRWRFVFHFLGVVAYVLIYFWLFEWGGLRNHLQFLYAQGSILGRGWAFIFGGALAYAHCNGATAWLARRQWLVVTIVVNALAAIAFLLGFFGASGLLVELRDLKLLATKETLHVHTFEAMLWTFFLWAMLASKTRWLYPVCNPLLARFGVISYSLYLLHLPIIAVGLEIMGFQKTNTLPPLGELCRIVLLTAPIACLVSWLSYRYIEVPFLSLKKR